MRPLVATLDSAVANWRPSLTLFGHQMSWFCVAQGSFSFPKAMIFSSLPVNEASHTLPMTPMSHVCLQSPVYPLQSLRPRQENLSMVSVALWWSHVIIQGRLG